MTHDPALTARIATEAAREARALLDGVAGVCAVVVATPDGFDIASALHGSVDASRLAAMSSSISAIGDVVSHEIALGRSSSVTIEMADGFALVQRMRHRGTDLVVCVVADRSAVLAQVVYRSAQFARNLAHA